MTTIDELKQQLDIRDLWRALGCAGEPGKSCRAPHRPDSNPSFSVHSEGTRWKDFGSGEGGDALDFIALIRGTDTKGAITWAREYLGEHREATPARPSEARAVKPWPELRPGSDADFARLSQSRGIAVDALRLAAERGFLHFGEIWRREFWALSDERRQLVELRRLDGLPWPAFGNLSERKSHCIGSGKAWPLGIMEALGRWKLALLEGGPDFLAAHELLIREKKTQIAGVMAMLGGASRIAPEAAAMMKGREVWLYPHADTAGDGAAERWARALIEAGARVKRFDLSGIKLRDGSAGKDINDLLHIAPECAAGDPKWKEILP